MCRSIPVQTLCASGFDGRAEFEMSTDHVFPHDVLSAVILVEDEAGHAGARARAHSKPVLLCWVADTTLLGGRRGSQGTRAEALKLTFPLRVHSLPSQYYWHLVPRGEECWSKRGRSRGSSWVGAHTRVVVGNELELWAVSACFLCLVPRSKRAHARSSPVWSRFLTHVCVFRCVSRVWLFVAPWTVACQVPVHGILQARTLEWVTMPSSRGSSQLRDLTQVSCIAGGFFTTEPPGKPLLRIPISLSSFQTCSGDSQSILKEINPEYSLEGLMLKLKFQYFGHPMWRANSLEKTRCWERLRAGGEGGDRRWGGWMASPVQWTYIWANSRRWWRTGKPGMLQATWSKRVRHDWTTTIEIPGIRPQGWGVPIYGLNCSFLKENLWAHVTLLPLLCLLPGVWVLTSLLLFPSSQHCVDRIFFASLQLVFSEDGSTCRCVFDVFLVGDELRVLLCHFQLLPGTCALVIFSSPKKSGYFYIVLDNLIFLLVWISW